MTGFLARISARRPLVTIAIWLVVAVIAGGLGSSLLDSATTTELRLTSGADSQRAADMLESRLRGPQPVTEIVVVQSETLTVDDPEFRHKVETVFRRYLCAGQRHRGCGPELLPGKRRVAGFGRSQDHDHATGAHRQTQRR